MYAFLDIVFVHPSHFFEDIDLLVELRALFDQLVILLVKLIDIVEKLEVLLFALDVGRDDLIDVADTCGFHDCLECLLNDLSVSDVLVEQALLLDVFVQDGVESDG